MMLCVYLTDVCVLNEQGKMISSEDRVKSNDIDFVEFVAKG